MNEPLALVVEDEPSIGDVFSMAMKAAGFQTELINSGDKALTWLATNIPDVVVLDLRLPYVSGVEILHHIRADPRMTKTVVIVITAYPKSGVFLQKRADLVLIKPISFVQLRDLAIQLYSQVE